MKAGNWLLLLLSVLLAATAPVAPFLPGSGNDLSHSISRFAQTIGYIVLPMASIGLLWLIIEIRNKKKKTDYKFNPVPLYIVFIPVVACFTSKFALEKAADLTREKAIVKTEPLIAAIEKYRIENGDYPENLESLNGRYIQEIPKPNIMGMRAYRYEKRKSSFQITFERLWHWNATEVVVYNTLGQKGIQGNYENYPTRHTNWWYYLAD